MGVYKVYFSISVEDRDDKAKSKEGQGEQVGKTRLSTMASKATKVLEAIAPR